jgi:hypothetical protein
MMKSLLICCSFLLFSFLGMAQNISISFDFSNAEKVLEILKKNKLSEEDKKQFLNLPATQGAIKKLQTNNDTTISALQKAINGVPGTKLEKRFSYQYIKENADSLRSFIKELNDNKQTLEQTLAHTLSDYVPEGKKMHITIYGILSGNSAGFTFGEDSTFYIGLQLYKNDMNATMESCKHELFHNIQSASYNNSWNIISALNNKTTKGASNVYYLLNSLYMEGTAEYIADPQKAIQSKVVKENWKLMQLNENRLQDIGYLFDRMILDVYHNPDSVDANKTYGLFFYWNWQSPGYYLGKEITKSLVNKYGELVLKKYLKSDPTQLILDYIKLSKEEPGKVPYVFSASFERTIHEVVAKANGLDKEFLSFAVPQQALSTKAYYQKDVQAYQKALDNFLAGYNKLNTANKEIFSGNLSSIYYNFSCLYSLLGNKSMALNYLKKSIQTGYDDYNHIQKDSDLDSIRNEQAFKNLLISIKKN